MTAPNHGAVFRATATSSVAQVALVSITVTTRAIVFTDARCSNCQRLLMAIPGTPIVTVRTVASNDERTGQGRVVKCHRCNSLCEIVEMRRPETAR